MIKFLDLKKINDSFEPQIIRLPSKEYLIQDGTFLVMR